MTDHAYNLAITWDRDSTMIGEDPVTGQKTFYVEGTDRGDKVTIEPRHHGNQMYQSLCFVPDEIHEGARVNANGQAIGTARFSNVPLSEWPNAAKDPELGAGFGVLAHVDMATDAPFVQDMWEQVNVWAKTAGKKEEAEIDAEIKRDQDMTAKTPITDQININHTIERAKLEPDTGNWPDQAFLRSWMFGEADAQGITIYTQRWPGREQGYDYTLPADADKLFSALVKYMRNNKNS